MRVLQISAVGVCPAKSALHCCLPHAVEAAPCAGAHLLATRASPRAGAPCTQPYQHTHAAHTHTPPERTDVKSPPPPPKKKKKKKKKAKKKKGEKEKKKREGYSPKFKHNRIAILHYRKERRAKKPILRVLLAFSAMSFRLRHFLESVSKSHTQRK